MFPPPFYGFLMAPFNNYLAITRIFQRFVSSFNVSLPHVLASIYSGIVGYGKFNFKGSPMARKGLKGNKNNLKVKELC